MTFVALFSTMNTRSQIHAADCRVVAEKKRGMVRQTIEAATAKAAAQYAYDEQEMAERGMPRPTICKCAR